MKLDPSGWITGWIVFVLSAASLQPAAAKEEPFPSTTAPPRAVLPMPPGSRVEGRDIADLTASWWRWALEADVAPYLDPDGRLCVIDQAGPVWFLAGTSGVRPVHRRCVVPEGKYLLLPVINMVYWQPETTARHPVPEPCARMQANAAVNNNRLVSAVVLIDNVAVADVKRHRVRSKGCFALTLDADGKPAADSRLAAADGYWLLLPPLAKGRHTIVVGANYDNPESPYGRMVQNFDYAIDVGGETLISRLKSRESGSSALVAVKGPE